jgi:hypothetical protein
MMNLLALMSLSFLTRCCTLAPYGAGELSRLAAFLYALIKPHSRRKNGLRPRICWVRLRSDRRRRLDLVSKNVW